MTLTPRKTDEHLSVPFEPRVGSEGASVTRDPDLNGGGNATPPEKPREDESLFEARGCDRGKTTGNLHKPGQAGNRRHCLRGFFRPLPAGIVTECAQLRKRQNSQGKFRQKKQRPRLNKDIALPRRKLEKFMEPFHRKFQPALSSASGQRD
jgi:hypothetical protein